MASEKSPFRGNNCYTPRPMKSREPLPKVINKFPGVTKAVIAQQRKGRKAPQHDYTQPRWHIFHGKGKYVTSNKVSISAALKDFALHYPERKVTAICPALVNGRIYRP